MRPGGRWPGWWWAEPTRAEQWTVARGAWAAAARTVERPAGALDLLGGRELLRVDAPHVVVAGVKDGRVRT